MGQFYATGEYILEVIGESDWPERVGRTRRAIAGILTEVLGGPHTRNLERRLKAYLRARIAHWESQAIKKQSTIEPADHSDRIPHAQTENEAGLAAPTPRPTQVAGEPAGSNIPDRASPDGNVTVNPSRRRLVDAFLARCNAVSKVRIHRTHIWRSVGHGHARQFEYWQAGNDRLPGTTRGATKQDDQNFCRVLAMAPEKFIEELRQSELIMAKT
jgi:hypothetical protein